MADFDIVDEKSRDEAADERNGVSVDRRRRQAVADDDREPARRPAMTFQQML
jgi:hypothetical protein